MQIDWITVAAQVVNFLVLVWLLQRFLYGPITGAMARREEAITSRLDDAKTEKERAEKKARDLEDEQQRLDERRAELMEQARADAEELRKRLEREAREDIEQRRRGWLEQIQADRAAFFDEMRERSAVAFRELAADALHDLADASLNDRLADHFLERLETLDHEGRAKLQESAHAEGRLAVETGEELGADVRRRLTRSIHDLIGKDVEIEYRKRPELGAGLRLRSQSQTIEWSMVDYLDRYIDRLRGAFPRDDRGQENDQSTAEPNAEQARG